MKALVAEVSAKLDRMLANDFAQTIEPVIHVSRLSKTSVGVITDAEASGQ